MESSKQINFLTRDATRSLKKIVPTIIVFIILFGAAFTTRVVLSSEQVAQQFGNTSVIEQIKFLVTSENKTIYGETEGRINILLLGIGGENHNGGQLTDTIMIASLDPEKKQMGLMSIPRDLVVPIKEVGWQKINSAHAYGVSRARGEPAAGLSLAKQTIENITGLNIHYYFKIDFEGFEKIVDSIGGIRVKATNTFTDYEYPNNNFGYQKVHFEKGWQNLDGDQALKYARSRHGTNGEGSDFARARRQQQILKAFQDRVMALSTLLNPNKLLSIGEIIGKHMETNMKIWELARLYEIGKSINSDNIRQIVLSTQPEGLLVSYTNEEGAYLLRPRLGHSNFSEIKMAAKNLTGADNTEQTKVASATIDKNITIAVQNGTTYPGLASKTANDLRALSYRVTQVANAQKQNYEKTVIYKLPESDIPKEDLQKIRKIFNANVSPIIPKFITPPEADLLIIAGENSI